MSVSEYAAASTKEGSAVEAEASAEDLEVCHRALGLDDGPGRFDVGILAGAALEEELAAASPEVSALGRKTTVFAVGHGIEPRCAAQDIILP